MAMTSVKFRAKIARMGPRKIIVLPKRMEPMLFDLLDKKLVVELSEEIVY